MHSQRQFGAIFCRYKTLLRLLMLMPNILFGKTDKKPRPNSMSPTDHRPVPRESPPGQPLQHTPYAMYRIFHNPSSSCQVAKRQPPLSTHTPPAPQPSLLNTHAPLTHTISHPSLSFPSPPHLQPAHCSQFCNLPVLAFHLHSSRLQQRPQIMH